MVNHNTEYGRGPVAANESWCASGRESKGTGRFRTFEPEKLVVDAV